MSTEGIIVLLVVWVCLVPLGLGDAITWGMARVVNYRTGTNKTVNYFVAGTFGQPLKSFEFMLDLPALKNDTIKFLPYSQRRAHFSKMAETLLADVQENQYRKVRIFAISVGATVGDHVVREVTRNNLEGSFELELHLINPCQARLFMQTELHNRLRKWYPAMVLLMMVLGPLAFVPVIPWSGQHFSVALTFTQVSQILFSLPPTRLCRRYAKNIVISVADEVVDNAAVQKFYGTRRIFWVTTQHSNTINEGERYRKVMEEILVDPRSV